MGSLVSSVKKLRVYTCGAVKEGYIFSGRELPSFEKQVLVSYQTLGKTECQVMEHKLPIMSWLVSNPGSNKIVWP